MNIPRQPIELGDHDAALAPPSLGEGFREFRPPIQGIATLASLDFEKFPVDHAAIGLNVTFDRRPLPLDAEPPNAPA